MHSTSKNDYAPKVTGNQTLIMKVRTEGLDSHFNKASKVTKTLDLSKKNLRHLTEDLYKSRHYIQNMHLEGNSLCCIPENLFHQLQQLVWLDLRYNELTSLPRTIGELSNLKYLLLEGNPITALPVELGDLSTLKALNLRHCPLTFPPENIVHKGLKSILSFLRNARTANHLSSELNESKMPAVEKLRLSELKSSLDNSEEWGNDEERIQFEILKNRIKQEELEEMVQGETFGLQGIPKTAPSQMRREKGSFLTELSIPTEESKAVVRRHEEEKDMLAVINQKQKDKEALKEWQRQTKLLQDVKTKVKSSRHEVPPAAPPYATDLESHTNKDNWSKQKTLAVEKQELIPRVMSVKSLRQLQKESASRDQRLENRIRQHIQTMQERKRNPQGTVLEEMEAAKKELEMASLLQAEIVQRKQEVPLEYRFTAFTGEISPRLTSQRKPQNIFTLQ
ncbi:leucine-rich repeat-containing protein 27 [Pelodytes ibericus]